MNVYEWELYSREVVAAIRAVQEMLKAPDFDRKMLLLATQISHQSEMKAVLLSVLEALLKTLKMGDSGEVVVEAMTLIRCMIRLALGLLVEPTVNRSVIRHASLPLALFFFAFLFCLSFSSRTVLIDTVVNHFQTGQCITLLSCMERLSPHVHGTVTPSEGSY